MQKKVEYDIKDDEFIIKNYNEAKPFASFFPGIAGLWGKPMWIFYVNRAQSISCMGTKDKDGSIMEFLAANKAYRMTSLQGFRTFIKIKDKFFEPFQNINVFNRQKQRMHISSHSLKLVDVNPETGLEISVEYFTLPNENFPALVRILKIKNISKKTLSMECIDGLPMINPYGWGDYLLKNMSRLAEGWFSGVEFSKKYKVPVYKLSVEPEDRPEVVEIQSANFYTGFFKDRNNKVQLPKFIVDPDIVFGSMKDFALPKNFIDNEKFQISNLVSKNKTPSGMGFFKSVLQPGKEFQYYSMIGNVQSITEVDLIMNKIIKKDFLKKKKEENQNIIRDIGNNILTKSDSKEFDNYTQQTFLDNLLRGGYPITIGDSNCKKNYYAFSRIHGDMEREYNNFVITPEYFSQGTGNYRDVNQNRRNDVFFNPEIKDESIIYFMNLIQTDGFNPLKIVGSKFKIIVQKKVLSFFKKTEQKKVKEFILKPVSLGDFFNYLEKEKIKPVIKKELLLNKLMSASERVDYANPGEGYWSDHWHYNIDLIESYLAVYPEELQNFLLKKKVFTFYDNPHIVVPRKEKYILFHNKPRQFNAVIHHSQKARMIESREKDPDIVRTDFGNGVIYKTTLIGKLICLTANKFASLDPEGVGIEMESGKPNWCDALNGLPGLFGSSLAETLELKRLIKFILKAIHRMNLNAQLQISTAREFIDFMENLEKVTITYFNDKFKFWDKTHEVKEQYWQKVLFGLSGKEKSIKMETLVRILNLFLKKVNIGIKKAFDNKKGVVYTNFQNDVIAYKILKEKAQVKKNINELTCITPTKFKQKTLPLFLEGPVHYLRISENKQEARIFHQNMKKSEVYDKKLKMFKVNAYLKDTSINIGRIKIFTRGWLENESIWMHMEYKYMLELLRNNLSEEFYKEMPDFFVPFMNPAVYGRSIFENVSFIASSAHPEKEVHGQGFVSRLSGSTAEFISMWIAMTSGLCPFYLEDNKLYLKFQPSLASWLFTNKKETVKIYNKHDKIEEVSILKNSFLFKFLGNTIIIYHNPNRKNTYGKNKAKASKMKLTYFNNKIKEIDGGVIPEPYSYDIRNLKVKIIDIWLG